MIKALIADDEKLVRMGFISMMPWEKFDIRVVGEANNGKAALDFMQRQQVDLLFADLTMPVMSGFELMNRVRTLFPDTWIVVLTCHQDFGYVQEALRIGAIDYIVKTQLEVDSMEEVLSRIVGRINYELKTKPATVPAKQEYTIEGGWLFVHRSGKPDAESFAMLQSLYGSAWIEAGQGAWFMPWSVVNGGQEQLLPFASFENGWILIKVHETKGFPAAIIVRTLQKQIPAYLFFEYEPGGKNYTLSLSSIARLDIGKIEQEQMALFEEWQSLKWLYDDALFATLCSSTARLKPEADQLRREILLAIRKCSILASEEEMNCLIFPLPSLPDWFSYVNGLKDIRKFIQQKMQKVPYLPDIIVVMINALHYINQTENFDLSRDDAAAKFNLSQGYFSQCFKEIVGKSFGEYLRERKMDKAKELLVRTNLPIYAIAELTGFKDEKYFSKMFRAFIGFNPMEYRKTMDGRGSEP
ncbi:response regulator [Paenibacillus sp. GCM10027626]|uniref:response regulator transcription factor n=1 Tax=Paenibacillus sp. GCM10027626 TaxID=3273411 RepID=UPI00363754E9